MSASVALLCATPLLFAVSCRAPKPSLPEERVEVAATEPEGIAVGLATWLVNRERPWAVDWWGLAREPYLTTTAHATDDSLRVTANVSHVFTGTSIVIVLTKRPKGAVSAVTHVEEWSDASAPRVWPNPIGSMAISSKQWRGGNPSDSVPLILEFSLSDTSVLPPRHVQGILELARQR